MHRQKGRRKYARSIQEEYRNPPPRFFVVPTLVSWAIKGVYLGSNGLEVCTVKSA